MRHETEVKQLHYIGGISPTSTNVFHGHTRFFLTCIKSQSNCPVQGWPFINLSFAFSHYCKQYIHRCILNNRVLFSGGRGEASPPRTHFFPQKPPRPLPKRALCVEPGYEAGNYYVHYVVDFIMDRCVGGLSTVHMYYTTGTEAFCAVDKFVRRLGAEQAHLDDFEL